MCNPSRAAFFTGKRASSTGVYGQTQQWDVTRTDVTSLMQQFKNNGYKVMGGGKVYHHADWVHQDPAFDECLPFHYSGSPEVKDRQTAGDLRFGVVSYNETEMMDYQTASFVIERLQLKQDKPFVMVPGLFLPHNPWWVPQKYFDLYPLDQIVMPEVKADDLDDVPEWGKRLADPTNRYDPVVKSEKVREAVQALLASISFADMQIGRMLDALDTSPYRDNTIVVLWGDNGFHMGEKLHFAKSTLWEESARIPFMMRIPGQVAQTIDRTVDTIDLYPTLVDLCGLDIGSYQPDGISMRPLIENPGIPWKPAITMLQRKNCSARDDEWTYIRYADRTEELYNRIKDPMEYNNLASNPEFDSVKDRLRAALPANFVYDAPLREGDKGYIPPSLRSGFEDTPY
jgi:arylsulfatase A-like enzyme